MQLTLSEFAVRDQQSPPGTCLLADSCISYVTFYSMILIRADLFAKLRNRMGSTNGKPAARAVNADDHETGMNVAANSVYLYGTAHIILWYCSFVGEGRRSSSGVYYGVWLRWQSFSLDALVVLQGTKTKHLVINERIKCVTAIARRAFCRCQLRMRGPTSILIRWRRVSDAVIFHDNVVRPCF